MKDYAHDGHKMKTAPLWYAVHSKPSQESRALENLERQGYMCYLPMIERQVTRKSGFAVVREPLFPRYLFISLRSDGTQDWGPIRSTRGVSRLVSFGGIPAALDDSLVATLKSKEETDTKSPIPLFSKGETVFVVDGPFAGLEAIYEMDDGEQRAMVLIELLGKLTSFKTSPANLKKK